MPQRGENHLEKLPPSEKNKQTSLQPIIIPTKKKPGFHLDEWTPWDVFVTVNGQLP